MSNALAECRCAGHRRHAPTMDQPELVAAHLARNLVALRHVRNLTQGALAKAAGVPRSTISNLESSSGNPSLTVLVKVANALGVPLDELLASPRAKVRKWTRDELASQSARPRRHDSLADSGARARRSAQRHGIRAGRVDARLAASAGHARVLHVPRRRSHDLRRRRSLRSRGRRRARVPRQRAAFVQESRTAVAPRTACPRSSSPSPESESS